MAVAGGEFWHHVHQGHVEEYASCGGEHPGGEGVDGAEKESRHHSEEGKQG